MNISKTTGTNGKSWLVLVFFRSQLDSNSVYN